MKVGEIPNINRMTQNPIGIERRESEPRQQSFQSKLSHLGSDKYMTKLSELGDRITLQGSIVAKRADIVELKRYREMVSEFMNEAVRFMFEFNKKSTLDARGRHKVYALIKKINKKLEELTQELLDGQRDNIAILQTIDEIRGMLLDLFM